MPSLIPSRCPSPFFIAQSLSFHGWVECQKGNDTLNTNSALHDQLAIANRRENIP